MSERPPELSIIIPAYNEEKRLTRTLARIRDYFADARARGEQIEVLVVNDGSTDGTAQVAREWMHEMPYLRDERQGYRAGIRNVHSPVVCRG